MARDIFKERKEYAPDEYPEMVELMDKIEMTHWIHNELTFFSDIHEIENLEEYEREAIIRSLLAISTVEVKVKDFWTHLGKTFPKPEFYEIGVVHGASESRHSRAYSRIIRLLGLEHRFKECLEVPAVDGRYKYLQKYLDITDNPKDFTRYIVKLILFTILIENVSLFSQFATVCYFYRHKGIMKDIRNVIAWSASDEQLHAITGITIVNILREEQPDLFTEEIEATIKRACIKSVKYEADLLDWVFENGEFSKLKKSDLLSYMKYRVNTSLTDMGFEEAFEDVGDISAVKFFEEEVFGTKSDDFFAVRPVDYTSNDIEISANTIF